MSVVQEINEMNSNDFRPRLLNQVVGQTETKEFLQIKIAAYLKTRETVAHTLFLGPSGIGKTTLANVVANEMGVRFHQIMATRIKTDTDLRNIIDNIEEGDVVFIDEIHALSEKIQEHLYGVMEDFTYAIEDKNLNKQVLRRIPRFTLIGATTHSGQLNAALLNRFQTKVHLLPYSVDELTEMIIKAADRMYNVSIPYTVAERLARLSRRTARTAYNLLRSLIDMAEASTPNKVTSDLFTQALVFKTLKYEKIDPMIGLDYISRQYIVTLLREKAALGSRTIANYIGEQESTVTAMIEPFLLSDIELKYNDPANPDNIKVVKSSFIRITKKGRIALDAAYTYIKLCQFLQKQGWFSNESLNIKSE
jgi:Holliday junction DNA helicase RuvB